MTTEAPQQQEQQKKSRVKMGSLDEHMFLIGKEGVMALKRSPQGKVKAEGWVDLEELCGLIAANRPMETEFMSKHLLFFNRRMVDGAIVHRCLFQFPPVVTQIEQFGDLYDISLPWIQFYCTIIDRGSAYFIDSCYISCTKTPLKSLDESIYDIILYNQNRGAICWGGNNGVDTSAIPNKFEAAEKLCQSFFSAPFNEDLESGIPSNWYKEMGNQGMTLFEYWADQTRKDPKFIFDTKFIRIGTARKLIEGFC